MANNNHVVLEEDNRQRLDVFIGSLHPTVSRAYIQKLCKEDQILVNDKPEKAGYKLRAGNVVSVPDLTADMNVAIPEIDLPILYQDDNCVVINKPIGVITHARGGSGPQEASVASWLRQYVSDISGERAGIVHRLDRPTSGVMVGARNPETLSHLQKQFAQRKTHKTYLAIVEGHIKEPAAIIDLPIERNPKAPARFKVGASGKPSQTAYKVLRETEHYSLVELKPTTGRTHQLRVHLAYLGHPIVGDFFYGTEKDRLYLHAAELEITLPGGERKTFSAPLPAEFNTLLDND
jgi:23S rRNA pseudouridine1911/1915/1917 synthase